jgi:hypothetical protein
VDEFYRTLALGWPVDAAMQTTRNAISIEVGVDKPDFATPVLYMRAKDGMILSGLQGALHRPTTACTRCGYRLALAQVQVVPASFPREGVSSSPPHG